MHSLPAPAPLIPTLPPLRPGTVMRPRLVRRLMAGATTPVTLIVAPAGYGKTTLLAEWAARDERPFVWVSLATDSVDDATDLVQSARRTPVPQVIVVDDADAASAAPMRRLLEDASCLPRGTTLALASRAWPAAGTGRLRAHGLLVELGAADLALTRLEAALLVDAVGARLGAEQLDHLLARTQGWPAALYLAAVSVADAPDTAAALAEFGGSERAVADYLHDELLSTLTEDERAFLRRTSILSRLGAESCDAVLETHGSGALLSAFERSGLPMISLDRHERAFRLHPLLAELLQAELVRREPELAPTLHRRAAHWHAGADEPAEAIRHAVVCGDAELGGRLLWSLAPTYAAEGKIALLGQWLGRFGARAISEEPALALTAAVHHLAAGRRAAASGALDASERAVGSAPPAAIRLLRACVARDGLIQMGRDANGARDLLPPDSRWQALAVFLLGVGAHLTGDRETARAQLEEAAGRATELPAVAALAHAQLALHAVEARDWDESDRAARQAHAALEAEAPIAVSALVLAACSVVAAHRGDIAQARHDATDADRLLAPQSDFPPWLTAEAHVWLARAEILLSDGLTARRLLTRAARLQACVADDVMLAHWVHDGWARADAFAETTTGCGPMLSNAELRVLRLLPSHMSFREIGDRLHVSTNTVKTQAQSAYRKLDVVCRSEAVTRARIAGLIA